jgi:DNA ligase D-like protein (predicted polymerase)
MSAADKVWVEVEGVGMSLSNLGKNLYPAFTKGEVIDYYVRVAPAMLPHVAGRAATRTRYPDGVEGPSFFEKNAPSHTPEWVRTVRLRSPGSTMGRETVEYVVIDDLPTLVWCANLAALELHVPQWRIGDADDSIEVGDADLLVFDLDPGSPATVVECCRVAVLLREALAADGLEAFPKTSGRKGLQLYVPVTETPGSRTSAYAKRLAQVLERDHPELVVSRMAKRERPGKVFVDWSQNNAFKTTVAPYSLRAAPEPTVSTPVGWDEVAGCTSAEDMRFTATDVLDRVADGGDLLAALLEEHRPIPDA